MTNKRDSKVMFFGGLDLGLATTTCNMCRHTDITFSHIYVCIYIYINMTSGEHLLLSPISGSHGSWWPDLQALHEELEV